jgi:hypothetical protein
MNGRIIDGAFVAVFATIFVLCCVLFAWLVLVTA